MSVGRRIAGLAVAFAVIVAVSAGWILHLRLGPPLDGWTAGPMVVFVPVMALVLSAIWAVVRVVAIRWVAWTLATVALGSAITALVIVAFYCGPLACFVGDNSNRQLGWFVLAAVVGAAIAYQIVTSGHDKRARSAA